MDHTKEEFITACRILENEGLGSGRALLQKGHGTLVGCRLEEAVLATIYLEESARIY